MSRQAQRVHKTFYRLKLRANFFIGSKEYQKEGFCWYRQINVEAKTAEEWGKRSPIQFIAPWTVVRSDEYVNKKLIAAKLSNAVNKVRARSGDGITHYVGDDCPGGHFGDHVAVGYQAGTLPAQPNNTAVGTHNTAIGPEKVLFSENAGVDNWETAGGTTPEQNEAREFPKQSNSDNNVTGPTS